MLEVQYNSIEKLYKPQLQAYHTIPLYEYNSIEKLYKPQRFTQEQISDSEYNSIEKLYKPQPLIYNLKTFL